MNFREAMEYISQAGKFGIVPGLDGVRDLCGRVGDPQKSLRFVHVAGTNGKGSVCAYVANVLKCGGYRVGRYVSPVISDYRERIQVNDALITKSALCRHLERLRAACDEMTAEGRPHPTAFEIETVMGFLYFAEKKCDIVVLETGMGGALDATNVVENTLVAALTPISRDHMQFLGNTLGEIAAQKAGIIKAGCRVVTAEQEAEADAVIRKRAAELACPLTVAGSRRAGHVRYGLDRQRFDYDDLKNLEITLAGRYQIENAVQALAVLETLGSLGFPVAERKIREGMATTRWPGRFTVVDKKPYFIVDGAHNEDAARRLAQSLELYFPNRRIVYIMGMLKDKECGKVIALTHALADQIITVTPPDNPRALPAYRLAQEICKVHPGVTAADSLEEAVEMSRLLAGKEDVILAFGSLSFLGRMMEIGKAP